MQTDKDDVADAVALIDSLTDADAFVHAVGVTQQDAPTLDIFALQNATITLAEGKPIQRFDDSAQTDRCSHFKAPLLTCSSTLHSTPQTALRTECY